MKGSTGGFSRLRQYDRYLGPVGAKGPGAEQTDGAECSTVAYALIDLASGALRYSSAGHPPILVAHADGSTGTCPAGAGCRSASPRARGPRPATSWLPATS